jgi:phosphatidylserine/phosphatidylglycerophosphate/cardiolipin synthase-like enzyme
MRTEIVTTPQGLRVRAIAGTYVVLLAFDCDPEYRRGLLGFSIRRHDHTNGETIWLRGGKRFDLPHDDSGNDPSTRRHPIQKFHWGDYTAKSGRTYTYTIHAQAGVPGALVPRETIELTVTCEDPWTVGSHGHQVHFNRSAAASQAYASRFGDQDPDAVGTPARVWLSRGLEEALIQWVDAAQAGESLHLSVYEFEKPSFLAALQRARDRGVRLQVLYDALLDQKQKGPKLKSEPAMTQFGFVAGTEVRGRSGVGLAISHNKFMVLADPAGKAKAVWTGSTNWTDNGIYDQTNVGHASTDPALAALYLEWHQAIWQQPDLSAAQSRQQAQQLTSLPPADGVGTFLVLSPRQTIEAVKECARRVSGAQRMVCFTAPFAVHDQLEQALAGAPAQVFGLLNKPGVVGADLHAAPNTQLASAAALNKQTALELWQEHGQAEAMHHSGVFIHTKIILIDPLSAQPTVITGSANFSAGSCGQNDENQLFIVGEPAVADIYLGEFMRMFDHYYFRAYVKRVEAERGQGQPSGYLAPDDSWTTDFFAGGPRQALRRAFF